MPFKNTIAKNAELDFESEWLNPPAIFRPAPFWSLNDKLEPDRLQRQIQNMKTTGMGGFFMHSRYGLRTEYLSEEWFRCIRSCIEMARSLDMKAYLYDEDRYPSGSNGGVITRTNPNFRTHFLKVEILDHDHIVNEPTDWKFIATIDEKEFLIDYEMIHQHNQVILTHSKKLLTFTVRLEGPRPWENDGTYLDTMNAQAVAEFIRLTHKEYASRFSKDFGTLIPGIFTDEPNAGYDSVGNKDGKINCHWSCHFREEFLSRRGYDLIPFLPELIFAKLGCNFSKIKYDYFKTISELLLEAYTKQIGLWCQDHSLNLTGHLLWEEPFNAQISAVGSCMPHYEYMGWPGIDLLCDQSQEIATVKQCTSVAGQLGKERVLSEMYGCTGWDWPLEGHKFVADWQFAAGVNFVCPHLTHYSLKGGAKRDCPASISEHSPWWPYYKTVQDYLGRLSYMLSKGEPLHDVLLLNTIESAWGTYNFDRRPYLDDLAEQLPGEIRTIISGLMENHFGWDFGDETIISRHARVEGNKFIVGRMQYKIIIVPPIHTLRRSTFELLREFTKAGGIIMCLQPLASLIDAVPSSELEEFFTKCKQYHNGDSCIADLIEILDRRFSITNGNSEAKNIWACLKKEQDWLMLFMQSQNRTQPVTVSVSVEDVRTPVIAWDALSGTRTYIDACQKQSGLNFEYTLPPSGSALFTFGLDVKEADVLRGTDKIETVVQLNGPFDIELSEPNSVPLDYCRYRFGKDDYSELIPTLKADEIIRNKFGLKARIGIEHQPYYLMANSRIDTESKGHAQLLYPFHMSEIPKICNLAIENPQDYEITLNGKIVNVENGFWIDEDFKTINIQHCLKCGLNEIILSFDYNTSMEFEDLYLVGDFGVSSIQSNAPLSPGNVTVIKPVKQLKQGSWIGQGLDFYTGSVKYIIPLHDQQRKGKKAIIKLNDVSCTAVVIQAGETKSVLPWAPFEADITEAFESGLSQVVVEIIGGRKNILGPLHVPWEKWTVPESFSPNNNKWQFEYALTHHGINSAMMLIWKN
ncbi:MAG: hypothetical protein A2Y12_03595 [Planctomycetes bacterium GWF2_42_9]|nr:MAG: hypothetical protein A2Y12_03595 [Planctomycetes bacterium GWF2_42_9]